VASWDDVDEIERSSHFQEKTTFTIFSQGTGDNKIVILLKGQQMNGTLPMACVLRPLAVISTLKIKFCDLRDQTPNGIDH
jgi:hypothetical protein